MTGSVPAGVLKRVITDDLRTKGECHMSKELEELITISRGEPVKEYKEIDRYVREFIKVPYKERISVPDVSRWTSAFSPICDRYGFSEEDLGRADWVDLVSLISGSEDGAAESSRKNGYYSRRDYLFYRAYCLYQIILKDMKNLPEAAMFGRIRIRNFAGWVKINAAREAETVCVPGVTADNWYSTTMKLAEEIGIDSPSELTIRDLLKRTGAILLNPWNPWELIERYEQIHEDCMNLIILLLISDFQLSCLNPFSMAQTVQKLTGVNWDMDPDLDPEAETGKTGPDA